MWTVVEFRPTGWGFISQQTYNPGDKRRIQLTVSKADANDCNVEYLDLEIEVRRVASKRLGKMYHIGATHQALNAKTKFRITRFLAGLEKQTH